MKLSLWAFLTTLVAVAADGQNIAEALNSPDVALSAETNSLRFGIWCSNRTLVLRLAAPPANTASFVLLNASTNKLYYFWPKELERRFDIELKDGNGVAVAKTSQ